jgi:hypothetical protein
MRQEAASASSKSYPMMMTEGVPDKADSNHILMDAIAVFFHIPPSASWREHFTNVLSSMG